jgi:2-(1,2-epoxy-1,2-dihydrophenyl)acetyl-CoA isomerase
MNDMAGSFPISLSGPVLAELHRDGVAHVRLNRPDASNGLNVELLSALHRLSCCCTATTACARR